MNLVKEVGSFVLAAIVIVLLIILSNFFGTDTQPPI